MIRRLMDCAMGSWVLQHNRTISKVPGAGVDLVNREALKVQYQLRCKPRLTCPPFVGVIQNGKGLNRDIAAFQLALLIIAAV